jgi:outer membrane protein OmpA-like peptidoglycan-associated protein
LALSEDRAYAAKQYLISKGINAERLASKGYGETTPVASNQTDGGRQLNRRVEFRILKK